MTSELASVVWRARRIRDRLQRVSGSRYLGGWCAIASLLLCAEIGDGLRSFRATEDHAWNQFDDTIVDVTASQFVGVDQGPSQRRVRGVLVTQGERWYHLAARGAPLRGRAAVHELARQGWYDPDDPDTDPVEARYWQRACRLLGLRPAWCPSDSRQGRRA